MHILLTNDDGINAEGLNSLKKELTSCSDIDLTIIAPDSERSSTGHKVNIFQPVVIKKLEKNIYAISGTPADCVKIALNGFLEKKVDLILSGINNGPNMGIDIYYSGTVAAAREACFHGVSSIALSLNSSYNDLKYFTTASNITFEIIKKIILPLSKGIHLNINFPNMLKSSLRGFQITSLGERIYNEKIIKRKSPSGRPYFWIGGHSPAYKLIKHSDFYAVHHGYVSITPLQLDVTSHSFIDQIKNFGFDNLDGVLK